MIKSDNKSQPKTKMVRIKNRSVFDSVNAIYEGWHLNLNSFKSGTVPLKKGKGLKILTTKQMLESLPIALTQLKVGNTSKNLLNQIRQVIYSLYPEKEVTKKVYKNKISSIKLWNRMDIIFMNSGNSKTNLKGGDIHATWSNFSFYYTCKNIKKSY